MLKCNFREIDILVLILDCFAIAANSCGAADEVSFVKLNIFFNIWIFFKKIYKKGQNDADLTFFIYYNV